MSQELHRYDWKASGIPFLGKGASAVSSSGGDWPFSSPISGLTLVRVKLRPANNGDNDLYTVPAGKRAVLWSEVHFKPTAGNVALIPYIVISGTARRVGLGGTVVSAAAPSVDAIGFLSSYVAEAGEIFRVNYSAADCNSWYQFIEFDNTVPIFSPKVLDPVVGDYTLYTCPASSYAHVSARCLTNGSGSTITHTHYLVPSGDSKGNTNQLYPAATLNTLTTAQTTAHMPMEVGDFWLTSISVNDMNPGIAYLKVQEFDL